MEKIGAKKMMVSLMVLMIVVLAQGRAELEDIDLGGNKLGCAAKCGLKCVLKISPPRIALCIGLCMVGCKVSPPQAVYDCTSGCANSMVNSYNPTDAEKVDSFISSCYETCKKNNNN